MFVLHNICEGHGEEFSEEWLEGVESQMSECGSVVSPTAQPQDSAVLSSLVLRPCVSFSILHAEKRGMSYDELCHVTY